MTPAAVSSAVASLVVVTFRLGSDRGTGFVVGHGNGYTHIITAAHVVGRKRKGAITWRCGDEFFGDKFEVERKDVKSDLALLRTHGCIPVPAIRMAERAPQLYDRAAVIGCPAAGDRRGMPGPPSYFGTVVDCRIAAIDGSNGDVDRAYQLSVPIGSGMSGGMLVNEAGELIGVAVAGDDDAFVSFCTGLEAVETFTRALVAKRGD